MQFENSSIVAKEVGGKKRRMIITEEGEKIFLPPSREQEEESNIFEVMGKAIVMNLPYVDAKTEIKESARCG